jgi:hypothetical protein
VINSVIAIQHGPRLLAFQVPMTRIMRHIYSSSVRGETFYARFASFNKLAQLGASVVPKEILSNPKGISTATAALLSAFDIPPQTMVQTFEEQATGYDEPYNPTNISDGRRRMFAEIVRRQGQQAFRNRLLSAYGNQCAVTRCRTEWVLEAAHITPYRGIKTNAVQNGLLLRADIHTLFDLALISIEPRKIRIRVSSLLDGSHYVKFDGKSRYSQVVRLFNQVGLRWRNITICSNPNRIDFLRSIRK